MTWIVSWPLFVSLIIGKRKKELAKGEAENSSYTWNLAKIFVQFELITLENRDYVFIGILLGKANELSNQSIY